MEKVYECTCGLWNRKKLKVLIDGKAICTCGNEMKLTEKDIQPIQNKLLSIDQVIKSEYEKYKEPIKRHGNTKMYYNGYGNDITGGFVPGCYRTGTRSAG